MDTELSDYYKFTFVQVICDELKELMPALIASKTLNDAYNVYEDYEVRMHNWTNFFRLRLKKEDKEKEDATI